jgi:hypothetical protein
LRTAAGLHGNFAAWQLRQIRQQLATIELLAHELISSRVLAMQVEGVLADVDT